MKPINMNIPHAADARAAIERGKYEKAEKQALEVEKMIKAALAEGRSAIGGDGCLEPSIKAKLEEMGYKYREGNQYNESSWSVSW